jgi:hypothetical protein
VGEWIDETGAPIPPDISSGNHDVPGLRLRLWRFPCDIVARAVEVVAMVFCGGAVVYG